MFKIYIKTPVARLHNSDELKYTPAPELAASLALMTVNGRKVRNIRR